MAKKLKTADYLLIGTLAVGGVGYYLYTKGKLPFIDKLMSKYGKKPPMESEIEKELPNTTPVAEKKVVFTPPKDPLKDPVYISKVKKIQIYLHTGADGDAGKSDGSQTNQALRKEFPKEYALNGRLTPSNVDKYVDRIVKGQASAIALQKDSNARKVRMAFGDKLKNLYYKEKAKIVRTTDTNTPTKYFDKARKTYSNDGGKVKILKNEPLFPKYSFVAYDTNGFWLLRTASGKFILQNPNEFVAK
jgi:hypothetical protein